jgi:hypothetical protein
MAPRCAGVNATSSTPAPRTRRTPNSGRKEPARQGTAPMAWLMPSATGRRSLLAASRTSLRPAGGRQPRSQRAPCWRVRADRARGPVGSGW